MTDSIDLPTADLNSDIVVGASESNRVVVTTVFHKGGKFFAVNSGENLTPSARFFDKTMSEDTAATYDSGYTDEDVTVIHK